MPDESIRRDFLLASSARKASLLFEVNQHQYRIVIGFQAGCYLFQFTAQLTGFVSIHQVFGLQNSQAAIFDMIPSTRFEASSLFFNK